MAFYGLISATVFIPTLGALVIAGCSNESDQWTTYHQTNTQNKNNCRGGKMFQINLKNNIKQSSEGITYDHRYFSFEEGLSYIILKKGF